MLYMFIIYYRYPKWYSKWYPSKTVTKKGVEHVNTTFNHNILPLHHVFHPVNGSRTHEAIVFHHVCN